MDPPLMRQPGRAYPMAARPMVDLPAPDSPISPSTSPRRTVRSIPLTISCQTSSVCPSTRSPRISSRMSPWAPREVVPPRRLEVLSDVCWTAMAYPTPRALFLQSARFVQEPVDDEIDADRQQRDRAGGQQRGV